MKRSLDIILNLQGKRKKNKFSFLPHVALICEMLKKRAHPKFRECFKLRGAYKFFQVSFFWRLIKINLLCG